jgi:hypothetical protein
MKIRKVALAAIAPAAVAGLTLSSWAAVQATTCHQPHPVTAHLQPAHRVHPKPAKPARRASGQPGQPGHRAPGMAGQSGHRAPGKAGRSGHRTNASVRVAPPSASSPATAPSGSAVSAASAAAPSSALLQAGMSAFEQCVAWRESGDNPTASSAGLFGILPAIWASLGYTGTAGQATIAQQKAAFSKLYAEDGTQPWAPYDGC